MWPYQTRCSRGKAACAQFGLDQFQIVCGQCVNVYLCQRVCAYVRKRRRNRFLYLTKNTHYNSTDKLRSMWPHQTWCSLSEVTLNNTGASFKYRVVSVRTSVRMRECMCVCVCVRATVRMRACMRVCARPCACACVCAVCVYVCVRACVCVCKVSRASAGHLRKRSTDSVSWTYI